MGGRLGETMFTVPIFLEIDTLDQSVVFKISVFLSKFIGVRRGLFKQVEDGRSPPVRRAIPETAIRPFQGWPAEG
jgi:hypothetical protein